MLAENFERVFRTKIRWTTQQAIVSKEALGW